jgi:hypothetical protein
VKRLLLTFAVAAGLGAPGDAGAREALAQRSVFTGVGREAFQPGLITWQCVHADHQPCRDGELQNPYYKQVLMFSAGFRESERDLWWSKFDLAINRMTSSGDAGSAWSVQKRDRLLFVGYFTGGDALNTPLASFGASVFNHPIRGRATSLRQDDVYNQIDAIRLHEIGGLNPFTAGVLFNTTESPVTANASPPSFVRRPFGIAKFTVHDIDSSAYVITHEYAHAGLNYLDEYTEHGFQDLDIHSFDVLTPLVQLDGTWGGFVNAISNFLGIYSVQVSEILANNGNENISTSRFPSTVSTPGYNGDDHRYEGGMFFGHGTWHMPGANLMDSNFVTRGPDDGFAFAHSPAQQRIINLAFGDGSALRPNDRLVNAGPFTGWKLAFGPQTHVMLRDADKHHHFQPTQWYAVQVGWYERRWRTCWAAFVPYPCYDDIWTTAQNWVPPSPRSIDLKMSSLYSLVGLAQRVLCELGVDEIPTKGGKIRLCQQDLNTITDAFLPTAKFDVPYQDVEVPASQWLTTYYWRFATWNGRMSGWTGWSSFYRSL